MYTQRMDMRIPLFETKTLVASCLRLYRENLIKEYTRKVSISLKCPTQDIGVLVLTFTLHPDDGYLPRIIPNEYSAYGQK